MERIKKNKINKNEVFIVSTGLILSGVFSIFYSNNFLYAFIGFIFLIWAVKFPMIIITNYIKDCKGE